MNKLSLTILVLALAHAALCAKGELLVSVRPAKSGEAAKSLGTLSFDLKGSLSTSSVEITNQDLYSSILKDAGATYFFEFKHQTGKLRSLRASVK